MAWRVARSLDTLLRQLNDRFPNRSRKSDGSIGDASHQSRASDHNAWFGPGIVTARDYTHDPVNGPDIGQLSDELAASRDKRIKYIIANGMILDTRPGRRPWQWVPYFGSNRHDQHLHLSVMDDPCCDDPRPWNLPMFGGAHIKKPLPKVGVLDMPAGVIPSGSQVTKLVMPIGSVSGLVAKGWLSLASSENATGSVWVQGPKGGISNHTIVLVKDKRWWIELPDGADQMTIHTNSPGSVGWCLELQPK